MASPLTTPGVWSARDTTPAEIDDALRKLMSERSAEDRVHAPARVLNLVVISDREWKGEISNRLDRIGHDNPARTILVVVEEGKEGLDASAMLVSEPSTEPGLESVFRERVEIDCGTNQLSHIDTIVYPVLAAEVGTVVWSPHGHPEAVDAMLGITTSVLLDSLEELDPRAALRRSIELSQQADVIDLAWLRSTPWRERLAGAFDPPTWRPALAEINKVIVRMHPGSGIAALLFLGWLASRLEWEPEPIDFDATGDKTGTAHSHHGPVELVITDDETMPVPGLSGVTIETASGLSLSLDRGSGGLTARRRTSEQDTSEWSVIGASRGEDGILAHGVTNAMLPDPLFRPALTAARTMIR
ncbi:MAG: glucose-6-phosphate dehydrogenase assembly protein OpcA [Solirubrobacterales bacterium]